MAFFQDKFQILVWTNFKWILTLHPVLHLFSEVSAFTHCNAFFSCYCNVLCTKFLCEQAMAMDRPASEVVLLSSHLIGLFSFSKHKQNDLRVAMYVIRSSEESVSIISCIKIYCILVREKYFAQPLETSYLFKLSLLDQCYSIATTGTQSGISIEPLRSSHARP